MDAGERRMGEAMGTRRVEETRAVSSEAALVVTKSGLHFKPSEAAWRRTVQGWLARTGFS